MLIKREITKPTKPRASMPRAEIFEIFFHSSSEGFLRICQTLMHFKKNVFSLSLIIMKNKEDECF